MRGICLALLSVIILSAVPVAADLSAAGDGTGHVGFAYREEIDNPGTRSAGARGLLTFDGSPLQGYNGRQLRTPIGSFHYVDSERLWDPRGWFPMAEIPVSATDVPFEQADQAAGFYGGAQRAGTPGDWCYDPGTEAWYDPERLVQMPAAHRQ